MSGWELTGLAAPQVATVAGVGAALVILWFLFRPRPPRVVVSSHVLWDQVAPKKRNPLHKELLMLALQLLMVVGLALALGDPERVEEDEEAAEETEKPPLDRVHIVDVSQSMGARSGAGSRLDVVRDRILGELAVLPREVDVALIGAARAPTLVSPLNADRARLQLALRLLKPEGVGLDLAGALALANALEVERERTVVEVWTDDPAAEEVVSAFAEESGLRVLIRAPFLPAPNLAVVAFDLRAAEGIPAEEEALVRVANPSPWSATATLALETEDAILGESRITIAAGEEIQRRYRFAPLPSSGIEAIVRDAVFEGAVDPEGAPLGDALAADDVAYAWVQPVEPVTAWLVSDGNRFLERVLALLPGVQLTRITPQQYRDRKGRGASAVDVVFFDGFAPLAKRDGPLPPRSVLFGPPASRSPVEARGAAEKPVVTDWNRSHELFEGLVLRDLNIEQSVVLTPADGDIRLLGTTSGALAVARDEGDRRVVVWGFRLSASDLPLRLAFPQTIVNLILWMRDGRAVGEAPGSRWRLEDPFQLAGPVATVTDLRQEVYAQRAEDPIALRRASWEVPVGDEAALYRFPRPGLFRVDPGAQLVGVNLETLEESRLADVPAGSADSIAAPAERPPEQPDDGPRPWWLLSLGVAAIALIEFGIYTR